MRVLIVQLGDLHVRLGSDPIIDRTAQVFAAVEKEAALCDMVFLAYCGDIAATGQVDEYLEASQFAEKLLEHFGSLAKPTTECLFIPGNHDCHFESETEVRKTLVASISSGRQVIIDEATIEQCTKIQDAFFGFLDAAPGQSNKTTYNRLLWTHTYGIDGLRIVFRCLNTSWITQLPEKPGSLVIPDQVINELSSTTGDLNVVLMHHPAYWLIPEDHRKIRSILQGKTDLVLMGHEHLPDAAARTTPRADHPTWYFDGGVLQDPDDSEKSNFSSTVVSIEDGLLQARTWQHSWAGALYSATKTSEEPFILRPVGSQRATAIVPSKALIDFVEELGANIRHPAAEPLKHADIFVYPDLSCLSLDPAKRHSYEKAAVPSEEVINIAKESNFRIITLGAQKSGRTFLLKQCFKVAIDRGLIPIWIDGEKISSTKGTEIAKLVDREMKRQYRCDNADLISQHSNSEKVVLIDDLDKSRLNRKYRRKFLYELVGIYDKVIITSHDILEIEEVRITENETPLIYADFEVYQIKQFGNSRRAKLIRKWLTLGGDAFSDPNTIRRQLDKYKGIVDAVIGKNLVPAFPFFILILLQSSGSVELGSIQQSAYGYYYQMLILFSLRRISSNPEAIDAYMNFLSELAYLMFSEKSKRISESRFEEFISVYAAKYDLGKRTYQIADEVGRADLLSSDQGYIAFRYQYVYYFLVAQYIAHHLPNKEIQDMVEQMADKIFVSQNANIIMFLTYLSKDPFILNALRRTAGRIFADDAPATLSQDVAHLNSLMEEMPRLVLEQLEVDEAREKTLREKDLLQEDQEPDEFVLDAQDMNDLALIDRVTVALKMAEILGQIVKNYFGSLDADQKQDLVKNAFDLVLRPLGRLLKEISTNREAVVTEIVKIVQKHALSTIEDRDRIRLFAARFLFGMCCMMSFAFIERISTFVGTENLSRTFHRLISENPTVAYRLVDAAIHLYHFENLPIDELRRLNSDVSHNPMARAVLARLVHSYLYMFEVDYVRRQQICEEFDIEMAETRKIAFVSRDRKGVR